MYTLKLVLNKSMCASDDEQGINKLRSKVIKEFGTFSAKVISKNFNSCLEIGSFPEDLKCAEVAPM